MFLVVNWDLELEMLLDDSDLIFFILNYYLYFYTPLLSEYWSFSRLLIGNSWRSWNLAIFLELESQGSLL